MNNTTCFLCKTILHSKIRYDIRKTYTSKSNTLLITLLENVIRDKIKPNYIPGICSECCKLINELEELQKRVKEIQDRLCVYLGYSLIRVANVFCQTDVPIENVIVFPEQDKIPTVSTDKVGENIEKNSKPFECSVCFKKFLSKNGASIHLKKQHKQSKDVENKTQSQIDLNETRDNQKSFVEDDDSDFFIPEVIYDSDLPQSESFENKINGEKQNLHTEPEVKLLPTKNSKTKAVYKRQNSDTPKPYQCPECPKTWKTVAELRSHAARHNTDKPFICEICGKAYKQKCALDIHVGMHSGINPFKCEFCNKAFTQKGALHRHLPIHTGEYPHQCDLCGKRFVHHTSFNIHKLTHTGQKNYKCEVCGRALLSRSHLTRHMRVHTREKNYACLTCGKRFAERYNLVSHERLHEMSQTDGGGTVRKRHKCQICGSSFERKKKLEEHMETEHQRMTSFGAQNVQEYFVKKHDPLWPNIPNQKVLPKQNNN